MKYEKTLRLAESSMQIDDRTGVIRRHLHEMLEVEREHETPVCGFTEANGDVAAAIEEIGPEYGFRFLDGKGDGAFLVARANPIVDHGADLVIPRKPGKPAQGGHGERYVNWVQVEWEGELVSASLAHWLTGYRKNSYRREMHVDMTEAVVKRTRIQGRERALSFWMGDINVADEKANQDYDEALDDGQLISIWDATRRHPNTHDSRTIDVVGHLLKDKRVKPVRGRTYRGTSDHERVVGIYRVQVGGR